MSARKRKRLILESCRIMWHKAHEQFLKHAINSVILFNYKLFDNCELTRLIIDQGTYSILDLDAPILLITLKFLFLYPVIYPTFLIYFLLVYEI